MIPFHVSTNLKQDWWYNHRKFYDSYRNLKLDECLAEEVEC